MIPQDEGDRKPRFSNESTRERAASQPPRSSAHNSSPLFAYRDAQLGNDPSSPGAGARGLDASQYKPWAHQRYPPINRAFTTSAATPGRSASFSAMSERGPFAPSVRGDRPFPSTFEDDEQVLGEEEYDVDPQPRDYTLRPQNGSHEPDVARSRSHSLAAVGRVGLKLNTTVPVPGMGAWGDARDRVNSSASRYGEIRPPNRYTPSATSPHGSAAIPIARGGYQPQVDISNMSPFARDLTHMMLEEQQSGGLRDVWAAGSQLREEIAPTSGTTSRRHSVSVVNPRRGLAGFSPAEADPDDMFSYYGNFGSRSMMISDEELAGEFSSRLNMAEGPSSPSHAGPPSQPASLPIYANPHSRGMHSASPETSGRYIPMNLPVSRPQHGRSLASSYAESLGERGVSTSPGVSPVRGGDRERYHRGELGASPATRTQPMSFRRGTSPAAEYRREQAQYQAEGPYYQAQNTARYQPQQQQQQQQQGGDYEHLQQPPSATEPDTPLSEMGKGVPLHAVPASCPLFIVEFKAGRTDLFYCADRALDIRTGDLVIVEADRGRDLGKVVNDSITLAEVEAFQRQAAKYDQPPVSPGGAAPPKREVTYNPKRIYSKAHPGDAQSLLTKAQDEEKALQLCQSKVKQKKLPMDVVDAEYQWDRRKLTFYFVSDKRIDFRELVRELFRLYKTRIWMASLQGPNPE